MSKLEKYTLVYSITAVPHILFANSTSAAEPLSFNHEKFYIPPEVKNASSMPVEVRIYLFKPEGNLYEMTSNMLPASESIICQTAELSGLKLVKKVMDELSNQPN
jgi:hypothetical protein